ncbi:MAG TPA: dihydropteroate synthase [Thermoleophilaceae bacterium]
MSEGPLVMGIVNASPESFSDGAAVGGLDDQVALALRLRDEGASIVDVGGESGVSDRAPVDAAEEIRRVVPLIERLAREGVAVSVDTWKPEVARAALAAGATMVNDVSGLADVALADACAESGAALVIAHTAAAPKEKAFPGYDDVGEEVVAFLRERIDLAAARGVERIVLDPGPDLAKTPAETVAVLRALPRVVALGREVLLAVSRKDFVGALTGRAPAERLAGTLAAIGAGVEAGASILRVHDVAATADYLAVRAALRGDTEVAAELRLDPGLRRAVWHPLPRT